MKISQKFSDFNTEVNASVPYLVTAGNVTRLLIPADTVTAANDFLADWNDKWDTYIHPATHTDASVIDINNVYHDFHFFIEGVKRTLKSNSAITLTGEDISTLHIHVNAAHRAHVPRPEFAPANQMILTKHLVVKLFTNNPQPSFENDTKLPTDVSKIGRKVAVMFAGPMPGPAPIPGPEQYHHIDPVGSTTYDMVFAPEQEGATAYIITWYMNPRGESGPESAPYAFKII